MSTSFQHRIVTSLKVTRGLFLTDVKRMPWGRVWQLFSRFTWELPQTLVGWLYTLARTFAGQVDRVDVLARVWTYRRQPTLRMGLPPRRRPAEPDQRFR